MMARHRLRAVVVGCSAGGLEALRRLFGPLAADFPLPILVVAHTAPDGRSLLAELLDQVCRLPVVQAEDKMAIAAGRIHVCPPGYHLLVEPDRTLSLSIDERVCNVRPSIDVLFESAADVWGEGLVGIVLTGANRDGTNGLLAIRAAGGHTVVEDPDSAYAPTMPRAAIAAGAADRIMPVDAIAAHLARLLDDGFSKECKP